MEIHVLSTWEKGLRVEELCLVKCIVLTSAVLWCFTWTVMVIYFGQCDMVLYLAMYSPFFFSSIQCWSWLCHGAVLGYA